ncbi:MAG: hypothetical protein N2035_03335 [Chthoniobacterales bacterium]|nr:hypothetical protein [Chthoniobacterales bacterium]
MKKILVIKLDHIGDYAITLPWLNDLREKGWRVDVVVSPWNLGWSEVCPWIKKWHSVSFPGYERIKLGNKHRFYALLALLKFWLNVIPEKYDVAVDLRMYPLDWRGKLVAWLSGARKRYGLKGIGEYFLDYPFEEPRGHQSERIGWLLKKIQPDLKLNYNNCVNIFNIKKKITCCTSRCWISFKEMAIRALV